MRLYLLCETNAKLAMVNTATFKLANGDTVVIDRDVTEYGFTYYTGASEGYFLDMTWKNCYIWNGDYPFYGIEANDFEGAELVSLDVEDDAPKDYKIKVIGWKAYD